MLNCFGINAKLKMLATSTTIVKTTTVPRHWRDLSSIYASDSGFNLIDIRTISARRRSVREGAIAAGHGGGEGRDEGEETH
jgi:hypothetical protein